MQKSKIFKLIPVKHEIESVMDKIASLLRSLKFTDYSVQTQTMIIRQLLKNGIKYSNFAASETEITIGIHITDKTITFEVMNPVDPKSSDSLRELDKTIQFIQGYQDPFEAFIIKHKEAVKNTYQAESDGLENARIAYKGNVTLDFIIGENNTLIQSAVGKLEGNRCLANSIR